MRRKIFKGAIIAVTAVLAAFSGPIIVMGASPEGGEKDITFIATPYSHVSSPDEFSHWVCPYPQSAECYLSCPIDNCLIEAEVYHKSCCSKIGAGKLNK